jgi:arabinose-5-phosphate isomerase
LSNILHTGRQCIQNEANALQSLISFVNESFEQAVNSIKACKGRVIISGIGKTAIVAQKIVATFNSTGTPSIFLHAADAIHGDMGMVQPDDVVIIISKSGESPEIKVLIPLVKNFGNTIIAIAGNMQSYLATHADIVINTTVSQEACPNNLAPTSSTTAQMAMGDALAVCLMELNGFTSGDFAKFHPGGALGKKLYLRVQDLINTNIKPQVKETDSLQQVIIAITKGRLGATAVLNEKENILGIITDGDLRRLLEKGEIDFNITAQNIMSPKAKTIEAESLAVSALDEIRKNGISQLIVTSQGNYAGILHLHDLIKEGII